MEIRLLESRMGIESLKKEHAMGKPVSIDQSHAVISALANNVDWSVLDGDVLQTRIIKNPREAGVNFTLFLKNGARVIIGIIPIDRSKPFNPAEFIGKGWTIAEQDERSLALTEVDPTKVRFENCLRGETSIRGEEKLKRLKQSGHIRLDAKVFQSLWENKEFIPETWKEKINGNICFIFFDGTILRNPDGNRYVLFLCWNDGGWYWYCCWLDNDWDVNDPSAVLAAN